MKVKNIMSISIISALLIISGCVLLVLGTVPMENTYDGKTLTVQYIVGKDTIDMTDAQFMPVPEEPQATTSMESSTHFIILAASLAMRPYS